MVAKSSLYASSLLSLIFNGTTFTGLARNDASPLVDLYLSLHTADPGPEGTQLTNEATFSGYFRMAAPRGSWTVTGPTVSLTNTVVFPISIGGNEVITYFGIGTNATNAGLLLYFGPISPTITVNGSGITCELTGGSIITEV